MNTVLTYVIVAVLLFIAAYYVMTLVNILPSAIDLSNTINEVGQPTEEEKDATENQRIEAQQKYNNLLN